MPPTDTPAIAVSPARLLGAVVVLALIAALALLLAWRRARVAAINEPLVRLRGFHIFGPDDGEEAVIHVPVLTARPVVRTRAAAVPRHPAGVASAATPAADRPQPAAAQAQPAEAPGGSAATPAAAAATATAIATPPAPRPRSTPAVLWSTPAATVAAVVDPPTPRRRTTRAAARAESAGAPDPAEEPNSVTLEGTAAPPPRSRPRRTPSAAPARPGETGPGRDILLVEDDATIAEMYAMLLSTKGYVTRHARDGLEGIAMVREELPSLVLLDMMMPRMDGLQFLEALRGWPRTSDLPVVILSNVSDRHLVDKAMRLGAIEYLVKAQTRPQVLLGALPHWLRGNRALTTLS